MSRLSSSNPENHVHGPENADHELRKAYSEVITAATVHFWDRKGIHGVSADEVITLYKRAFQAHRKDDRLAAERWARAAKHLARAFVCESKIAYLEPRVSELPYIEGATPEEYGLSEAWDLTEDLLNSVAFHIPPGLQEMPEDMRRYLGRARKYLEQIKTSEKSHELLRAQFSQAAHEYGRVVEILALAYEAEASAKKAA